MVRVKQKTAKSTGPRGFTGKGKKSKRADTSGDKTEKQPKKREFKGWRPNTVARRDVKRLQKSTSRCLKRAPIERLSRALANEAVGKSREQVRFTAGAIDMLHEMLENELISDGQWAMLFALHGKRKTVGVEDWNLVWRVRHGGSPLAMHIEADNTINEVDHKFLGLV